MDIDFKIAQMFSSKLCHDLIIPIGSVNSGLELLSSNIDQYKNNEEVLNLIKKSANIASLKLSFYRAAIGFNTVSQFSSYNQLCTFINKFLVTSNIYLEHNKVDYSLVDNEIFGKLILNIILCIIEVAPYGGALKIVFNEYNDIEFILKGKLVFIKKEVKKIIKEDLVIDSINTQFIQTFYTKKLAEKAKLTIDIDQKNLNEIKVIVN